MINLVDQRMMCQNALIFYRNRPVFVDRIVNEQEAFVFDLKEQRQKKVKWDIDRAAPMARRLGMINTPYGAVYLTRMPVRKFSIGLRDDEDNRNIAVAALNEAIYNNRQAAITHVRELRGAGIRDAIMGVYPTLDEAWELSKSGNVTAFDRQFAVDGNARIYYKTTCVGYYDPLAANGVNWFEGCAHLGILLDGNWKKQITKAN